MSDRNSDRRDERGRDGGRGRDDDRSSRGREDNSRDRGRGDDRGGRDSYRGRETSSRGGGDDRGGRSVRDGRRNFTYQARDPDETRRRSEQVGDFDSYISRAVKLFKPQDRDNAIRILPPTWEGPKHYGLDIWVHYGIGPDENTYLCLHKMKGEACPVCDERKNASRQGDETYAKELEPKRRVLVYLVDRNDEREGVQAYAMPQGLDMDITKVSIDKRSGEVLQIDHPDTGYDVMFEKSGAGKKTRYEGVQIDRRDSPLGDMSWLDFAMDNPLPAQLVYYSYEHIQGEFGGGGTQRGRDAGDSRDGRDERGGGRGDDRGSDRRDGRDDGRRDDGRDAGRPGREEPQLTWDAVHGMTGRELDDLVELERLNINPNDAKSDEELADWICEELRITPAPAGGGRERVRVTTAAPADRGGGSGQDRLAEMRQRREQR